MKAILIIFTLNLILISAGNAQGLISPLQAQSVEELWQSEYGQLPPQNPEQTPLNLEREGLDRIIIAGDSWAAFPCRFQSMEKMIEQRHIKLMNDWRCKGTSDFGMRATKWLGSPQDQLLEEIITQDKRVKYLYLSLGGNDLMDSWNMNFTEAQTTALVQEVLTTLKDITAKYLKLNPELKIVISGYDYANFRTHHFIPLYKRVFEKLGKPEAQELNQALIYISQQVSTLHNQQNIFVIHHLGLGHYYDGVPHGILRLDITLPPDQISTFENPNAFGGNPEFPNSDESMLIWAKTFHDAFHLSETNYLNVMLHTYDNVLSRLLNY